MRRHGHSFWIGRILMGIELALLLLAIAQPVIEAAQRPAPPTPIPAPTATANAFAPKDPATLIQMTADGMENMCPGVGTIFAIATGVLLGFSLFTGIIREITGILGDD